MWPETGGIFGTVVPIGVRVPALSRHVMSHCIVKAAAGARLRWDNGIAASSGCFFRFFCCGLTCRRFSFRIPYLLDMPCIKSPGRARTIAWHHNVTGRLRGAPRILYYSTRITREVARSQSPRHESLPATTAT
jgi:hypothetical protein